MSGRHSDSTENAELRAKLDEAKQRLALPNLMRELGCNQRHIGKTALCPFHSDEHPSFSVFQSKGGKGWQWKCHAGCGNGDEIAFLVKHFGISRSEAIQRYLDMAGFLPSRPPKSRECPKSHEYRKSLGSPRSPEYPESLVYPVSNGQGLEEELKRLAARNTCNERGTARKKRWQLARDIKAVEKRIDRRLSSAELILAFNEWHCFSQTFLDPAKTREDYLAMFLGELGKVRVPTGEGDTFNKALEHVSTLAVAELPEIPDYANAP
jgi:hypothetical protein